METKSLLFGLIGFFLGGLLVSLAATTFDKPSPVTSMTQMTEDIRGKEGSEFDEAFVSSMIHHHQAAVDMAELAKQKSDRPEVKNLANTIISAQSDEITLLQKWQKEWGHKIEHSGGH